MKFSSLLHIIILSIFFQNISAQEISITPISGKLRLLVIFLDYKDIKFDEVFKFPEISIETKEKLIKRFGKKWFDDYSKELKRKQVLGNHIDKRDPIDLSKGNLELLRDYFQRASHDQLRIEYNFVRVQLPIMSRNFSHQSYEIWEEGKKILSKMNLRNKFDKFIYLNAPADGLAQVAGKAEIGGKDILINTSTLIF
jgi:hypothetical protein